MVLIQFTTQAGNQLAALLIDRADSTEVIIVFGHFQHAFAWYRFASQHILKERDYILTLLGAAEGKDQNGVIFQVFR